MNESIFTPASFYLCRTPVWPVEKLEQILSHENWIESLLHLYETDEWLREAISIASPSLYQSLQKKPLKDTFQTAQSLLNYTIRMASRTIPFGLFSFVSQGIWGKKKENFLPINAVYKRARPDMEWIFALIHKIYQDPLALPYLPIKKNPLLSIKGDRIFLNFQRGEIKGASKTTSISATSLVKKILKLAEEPILISALLNQLEADIDPSKTMEMIQNLLSHQFLLPGLLPSMLNTSPFQDLVPHLPSEFALLAQEIEAYNKTPPGKGEIELVQLQKKMAAIAPAKTYLQVDSAHPDILRLPSTIKEELEHAASFLWKLSAGQTQLAYLKSYHEKFVEKYGTSRTIPLLELFHQEKGLGSYLEHIAAYSKKSPTEWERKWGSRLSHLWQECLHAKKREIALDDSLIAPPDPLLAPFSFDLYFKIAANSEEEIKVGDFSLIILQTTGEGGSSFGRFVDILSPDFQQKLIEFHQQEELLDQNALFAEMAYFPKSPRSANVAIHPCMRPSRIDLESSNSLSLNEIYVGAHHDRFYLTQKGGEKEINGCIGHLLTLNSAPEPLRFIREVSLAKKHIVMPFSWGSLSETAHFLPRVCYKKSIISLARWKFCAADFIKEPLEKIEEKFIVWAEEWNLPHRFLWAKEDQLLLLDRTHPANLNEITRKLKNGETLYFLEYIESCWMKREGGKSSPEMVLPLTKKSKFSTNAAPLKAYEAISFHHRWKLPASEWLFLKFYRDEEERERFLIQYIAPFAEHMRKEGAISSWFFLNYRDPDPHLRFRLRLASPQFLSDILPFLQEATKRWMEEGLIKNMVITGYEREVERYGGVELIDAAEDVFFADSLAIASLLQTAKKQLPEALLHPLSVIRFLSDFGFDIEESLAILNASRSSDLKGFREHKQSLIALLEDSLLDEVSELRKAKMLHFSSLAKALNRPRTLYNSFLHMHCNRLGCQAAEEQKACQYASHALLQLQQKYERQPANTLYGM
jgi:class I lanthipeptide synthase